MKRKIIKIDREKCDGCGLCIPDCPEGALQVIEGKARLVSDLFCDGLGACLGTCPQGAIAIEERDAELYDEIKVMENIVEQGPAVVLAHLKHLREHNESKILKQAVQFLRENPPSLVNLGEFEEKEEHRVSDNQACGCPGAAVRDLREGEKNKSRKPGFDQKSDLQNWPVQLQLINPRAPYFRDADLLVSADCAPYALADFHRRFLAGKILITFCPKLDKTIEAYIDKLQAIFQDNVIRSVSVVHMEVPCCNGILNIVKQALLKAKKTFPLREYTVSIKGQII